MDVLPRSVPQTTLKIHLGACGLWAHACRCTRPCHWHDIVFLACAVQPADQCMNEPAVAWAAVRVQKRIGGQRLADSFDQSRVFAFSVPLYVSPGLFFAMPKSRAHRASIGAEFRMLLSPHFWPLLGNPAVFGWPPGPETSLTPKRSQGIRAVDWLSAPPRPSVAWAAPVGSSAGGAQMGGGTGYGCSGQMYTRSVKN